MRLHKFRIKNFKSIRDSRDCYPERLTILAGKNEAGKSSILEALQDFNVDRTFRSEAIPIETANLVPEVAITFDVPAAEILEILAASAIPVPADLPESVPIVVTKGGDNQYAVSSIVLQPLLEAEANRGFDVLNEGINSIFAEAPFAKNFGYQTPSDDEGIEAFTAALRTALGEVVTSEEEREKRIGEVTSKLREAIQLNRSSLEWSSKIREETKKRLPNFVLFSSFADIFPNEIPISEIDANEWISDLKMMSNIDVGVIKSGSSQQKITHRKALNVDFDTRYREFWTQDVSHIEIEWDNTHIKFWIEENGNYYPPAMRSQGKRWHLSFYIRVSARSRPGVRNIILIDEPGLFLHAKAQRDILKQLEANSAHAEILFSTHSPYLIESDKLDRIRLVLKDETTGTYIENKVHAVADKETLTPILTAIGLEMNQGIIAADRRRNLVVEGPSDYFYLTALSVLTGHDTFKIISGGGAPNMQKVGTILLGWGCDVLYLYDNDRAYLTAERHVRKEWLVMTTELLAKLSVQGSIEDMFSPEDFADHVLAQARFAGNPGRFMEGKDKVLPAKLFLGKARGAAPQLSPITLDRFKKLFKDLDERFEKVYG